MNDCCVKYSNHIRGGRLALFVLTMLFLGTTLPACKGLRSAQAPTVDRISDFKVEGLREGQLHFKFKTRLNNPDRLRFKIRKVELDLMFNGVRIAQINTHKRMTIRRELNPEAEWNVSAALKPLISNPGKLIGSLAMGKVDFDLSGRITISKWGIRKTLPVKLQLPVTIPVR
ncbi:MAG: LEA type 2 family protein [Bacteroidia bacterium]|jgi:LEA14-like dessication related protein|nr:LEA type 2 family protein [Bacteroidia bacterium]MCC6767623.1 LEA type 2 family protein [Bacteroidia bacterium]